MTEAAENTQNFPASASPDCSTALVPDWHPLAHIDAFILACGWTHDGDGFVPPEKWRDAIRLHHGGGKHWMREHAAQLCIRYHERYGFRVPSNDKHQRSA